MALVSLSGCSRDATFRGGDAAGFPGTALSVFRGCSTAEGEAGIFLAAL
jgi:hypothetical protein